MTDGERWARQALQQLAAGRYKPRAWIAFIEASLRRARVRRGERPAEARTTRILGIAGVALWAGTPPFLGWAGASVGAAWWVALVMMIDWHLGMLESADGTPVAGIGVANLLSLGRAGLVPLLPALRPTGIGVVVIAAAVSDVLDGRLARVRGETTRLGHWLDGSADTLVAASAGIAAASAGIVTTWVGALIVARSAVPWLAISAGYFLRRQAPPQATLVSGRIPGGAVLAGLAMAGFGVEVGGLIAALGAAGGIGAWVITITRAVPSAAGVSGEKPERG